MTHQLTKEGIQTIRFQNASFKETLSPLYLICIPVSKSLLST